MNPVNLARVKVKAASLEYDCTTFDQDDKEVSAPTFVKVVDWMFGDGVTLYFAGVNGILSDRTIELAHDDVAAMLTLLRHEWSGYSEWAKQQR